MDMVAESIDWLTKAFLQASKSILRYFSQRFDIENDVFAFWPICVERGLNSTLQCELLRKGLSDRFALHCIDEYVSENIEFSFDVDICIAELKSKKQEVLGYAVGKGLPRITINRINRFLR